VTCIFCIFIECDKLKKIIRTNIQNNNKFNILYNYKILVSYEKEHKFKWIYDINIIVILKWNNKNKFDVNIINTIIKKSIKI